MSRAKPNAKVPTKKNKFAEIDAIHEKVTFATAFRSTPIQANMQYILTGREIGRAGKKGIGFCCTAEKSGTFH
jgi:hypothetical protein